MKCARCGQETQTGFTTEAVELDGGGLLVVRNIPCLKCAQCGEILYTGDVVEQLERLTDAARCLCQELTVIDYAKAA